MQNLLCYFCLFLTDNSQDIGKGQTRIYFQTKDLVWKLSIKFHSLLKREVSVQYFQLQFKTLCNQTCDLDFCYVKTCWQLKILVLEGNQSHKSLQVCLKHGWCWCWTRSKNDIEIFTNTIQFLPRNNIHVRLQPQVWLVHIKDQHLSLSNAHWIYYTLNINAISNS